MIFFNKTIPTFLFAVCALCASALSPVDYRLFYDSVNYYGEVQPGVWDGRPKECLKKASDTGYLMLWFLSARRDDQDCTDFLRMNICEQPFCDIVNNYKYLILCYSDYDSTPVRNLKNAIYGYPEPKKILDENTGQMVENHRGLPIHTLLGWDSQGKEIWDWCDYPPSLHLIKVDSSTNIIFHICKRGGVYEPEFSPYAEKFPIPNNMCCSHNAFAPWLQQYLDMYPVAEQIEEYVDYGNVTTNTVYDTETIVTTNYNYIQQRVDVAVTESVNPTAYQIALHRDNLLFRTVTVLDDILIKRRIHDVFSKFDDNVYARNCAGKWYITYDDVISAVPSEVSDTVSVELYASRNCTIDLRQRYGHGFALEGFDVVFTTNISRKSLWTSTGEMSIIMSTNVSYDASSTAFMAINGKRRESVSTNLVDGKIYRITATGNTTFDVFSTK